MIVKIEFKLQVGSNHSWNHIEDKYCARLFSGFISHSITRLAVYKAVICHYDSSGESSSK